jgi:hypothetical protein
MRICELCGKVKVDGMKLSKRAVCFTCIDKMIEFAVTAGMRFEDESTSL